MKQNIRQAFILLFFVILCGISFSAYSYNPNFQEDERNRAIETFHNGNFEAALPVFKKLADAYPSDYLLKYFTGASMIETGVYTKEAEMYLLLAGTRDMPAKVFYYLGRYYHAVNDWDSALRFYNRFKNNSQADQADELKIDELAALAYDRINPFSGAGAPVTTTVKPASSPVSPPTTTPAAQPERQPATQPEQKPVAQPETKQPEQKPVTTEKNIEIEKPEEVAEEERPVEKPVEIPEPEAVIVITEPQPEIQVSEEELTEAETSDTIIAGLPVETIAGQSAPVEPAAVELPVEHHKINFIHFQINSQVTYPTEDLFQVEEAREAWRSGNEKETGLNELMERLNQFRNQYQRTVNPAERDKLAKEIITLEQQTLVQKHESEQLYQKARNLEQQWWAGADFTVYEKFSQVSDSLLRLEAALKTASLTPVPEIDEQLIREELEILDGKEDDEPGEDDVIYKVQLGSFTRAIPARTKTLFDKIGKIRPIETFEDEDGATVYTTGNMKTYADGLALQNQVVLEGVKDASVIAIKQGKRISLQEAKIITKEE